MRLLSLLLALVVLAWAATVKLYLKDGEYHLVREYKVEGDRVRFYSTERSQWEEIPLELVDLKRTESEIKEHQEEIRKEAAEVSAEEQAERAQRAEIARVPQETGVYLVQGEKLTTIKQAEINVVSDKRRSVLKVLSPIPVVAGKSTVEINGEHSPNVVAGDRPEFYIRLAYAERFGIFKLEGKKDARILQKWSIVPISKEIVEDQEIVETFRRQVDEGLYKIWPQKPLVPGEYAVVEYTEGKGNIQAWDFAYRR